MNNYKYVIPYLGQRRNEELKKTQPELFFGTFNDLSAKIDTKNYKQIQIYSLSDGMLSDKVNMRIKQHMLIDKTSNTIICLGIEDRTELSGIISSVDTTKLLKFLHALIDAGETDVITSSWRDEPGEDRYTNFVGIKNGQIKKYKKEDFSGDTPSGYGFWRCIPQLNTILFTSSDVSKDYMNYVQNEL